MNAESKRPDLNGNAVTVRHRKRRLTLRKFWASLKLPFFEIGGEWKRKPSPKRKRPSRKVIERKIRAQIQAEQRATETPMEQMLREIEEESAKRFRKALRGGDLEEIGAYALVRRIAGDELRRRKGQRPKTPD